MRLVGNDLLRRYEFNGYKWMNVRGEGVGNEG